MRDINALMLLFQKALVENFRFLQRAESLDGRERPSVEYLNSDAWDEVSESLFFAIISSQLERDFGVYGAYGWDPKNRIMVLLSKSGRVLFGEPEKSSDTFVDNLSARRICYEERYAERIEGFAFVQFGHPFKDTNESAMHYVIGMNQSGDEVCVPLELATFDVIYDA